MTKLYQKGYDSRLSQSDLKMTNNQTLLVRCDS